MSNFIIQNFYQGQLVNQFNQEGMFTNSGQQIAAFFPKIPNISSGIGNISNNYGQIGSTNQFNFNNGIFQFPNQVGPVGSVVQYTFASYVSTGTKTITVPTDGTTYYIVAELLTTIIDPGQYSTSVVILNTAMTLAAIEADTNKFLPICAIVGNAGNYTVSLNNNCAYNYGELLSNNSFVTGDLKYSYQTFNHSNAFGTWLICDGSSFDFAKYPNLYALLGRNFLPSVIGRTMAMASGSHPVNSISGSDAVFVPLPQHNHGVNDPQHNHSYSATSSNGSDGTGGLANWSGANVFKNPATGFMSYNSTGISIQNSGTPNATISVIQPTLYVQNVFIFAN